MGHGFESRMVSNRATMHPSKKRQEIKFVKTANKRKVETIDLDIFEEESPKSSNTPHNIKNKGVSKVANWRSNWLHGVTIRDLIEFRKLFSDSLLTNRSNKNK